MSTSKITANTWTYLGFSPYLTAFFLRRENEKCEFACYSLWLENISFQTLHKYLQYKSISPHNPSPHITCELLQTFRQEQTFLGKNVDFLLQIWRCDPRFRDPDSFSPKLKHTHMNPFPQATIFQGSDGPGLKLSYMDGVVQTNPYSFSWTLIPSIREGRTLTHCQFPHGSKPMDILAAIPQKHICWIKLRADLTTKY